MADVLKFNIKENGFYSTLPYIAMWIMSIIFGTLSDFMLKRKWMSLTASRKIFTGAYYSGMKANNLDLSPNFSGAIMALTNGIGAIVGIVNVSFSHLFKNFYKFED